MPWEPIPVMRGARTETEEVVTLAWRKAGPGRAGKATLVAVLNVSRRLAASLGWRAEMKRVVVEVDRSAWRLRLRPAGAQDAHGRSLHNRSGTRFVSVPLAWVRSEQRPAQPVPHQAAPPAVILDLPEWAREGACTAAPAPRVVERATMRARAQEPDGTPAPIARPAATPLDARRAEAFADFDAGKTVRQVHEETGESLSDLANWHAQWKRERQQAAAREEAAA